MSACVRMASCIFCMTGMCSFMSHMFFRALMIVGKRHRRRRTVAGQKKRERDNFKESPDRVSDVWSLTSHDGPPPRNSEIHVNRLHQGLDPSRGVPVGQSQAGKAGLRDQAGQIAEIGAVHGVQNLVKI